MPGSTRTRTIAGMTLIGVLMTSAAREPVGAYQSTSEGTPDTSPACAVAPRAPAFFSALPEASPTTPRSELVAAFRAATHRHHFRE